MEVFVEDRGTAKHTLQIPYAEEPECLAQLPQTPWHSNASKLPRPLGQIPYAEDLPFAHVDPHPYHGLVQYHHPVDMVWGQFHHAENNNGNDNVSAQLPVDPGYPPTLVRDKQPQDGQSSERPSSVKNLAD